MMFSREQPTGLYRRDAAAHDFLEAIQVLLTQLIRFSNAIQNGPDTQPFRMIKKQFENLSDQLPCANMHLCTHRPNSRRCDS
jgi:hypothetical protein